MAARTRKTVNVDSPGYVHRETVEEFLARGGTISKISPNTAQPVTDIPMVHVDGVSIPVSSSTYEYIPSFVVSETTYVDSQKEKMNTEDVGLAQSWNEYEQDSTRPMSKVVSRNRREEE